MEEDKKKRKNKKRKNKQNAAKHVADTSTSGQNSAPPEVNHSTDKAQVDTKSAADVYPDDQLNLPKEDTHGATQQGKIQKLPLENDLSLQKEIAHAGLLEKLDELQKERVAHIQQEASLQEKISQLEKENDTYVKKEAALERKISELQADKEAQVQKESLMEIEIGQLQMEKESWFQKEVTLTEKVKHMEKERDTWVSQEKLAKELIASLNGDNLSLKSQVAELEELRSSLLQKNHLLKETISDLHSQILSIERTAVSASSFTEIETHTTENGNLAPETETANALVERLASENVALVENVKDLSVECQNKNLQLETSFNGNNNAGVGVTYDSVRMEPEDGVSEMLNMSPAYGVINEAHPKDTGSELRVDALKNYANNNQESNGHSSANNPVGRDVFPDSSKMIEADEIVQIPLDENEMGPVDVDSEPSNDVDDAEVALVDAPLIGAPFRLISFFARYVSGADLVEKNSVIRCLSLPVATCGVVSSEHCQSKGPDE